MKSRTILSVFAVFVALFSCSLIGYIFGAHAAPQPVPTRQNAQSAVQGTPAKAGTNTQESDNETISPYNETPVKSLTKKYILRESEGKVALFIKSADGTEKLHSSYDIPIMFLPQSDRDSLKKGIEFDSLDEIIKFAEDYLG